MTKQARLLAQGTSAIALALVAAPAVFAQDMPQATNTPPAAGVSTGSDTQANGSAVATDSEIVVTGSRLARSSFNSPTPVNVVGEERTRNLAIPQVADALNQLPAFRPVTTPSSALFRVTGAIGANTVDLRGLGPTRTLVLVDGRRIVPSTDSGTVDLNGIPSSLVKRTEVVTGGASAAYGADAVAGVVNLILDTKFTGVKFDVNNSISQLGDNWNYFASAAVGHDFAGTRGHFIAGVEYAKNHGVGRCETRAYCSRYTNYVNNPGYINGASTNGLPAVLVLDNVRFVENPTGILASAVQTVNGVNTTLGQQVNNTGATRLPAALQGLQFNAGGNALVPFQFGNFLSGQFMQGGDPSVDQLYGFGNVPLVTPTSHVTGFGHAEYELTDDIQLFGEATYSQVKGGPVASSVIQFAPIAIQINNPYITPNVRAQILAANPNITASNLNVAKPESGDQLIGSSNNKTWRVATGLKGSFLTDWSWDAAYTHGETHSRTDVQSTRLRASDVGGEAVNAITPPANYAGTIYRTPAGAPVICASSVANPANGCIPINYIGANSISPAALAKYLQPAWQTRKIKQDTVSANVHGALFDLWAGPLDVAVGGEYRRDTAVGSVDPISASGAFVNTQVSALPLIKRSVIEGYIEGSLPLLKDSPLGKSFVVDGALRRTHYNAFGNATTWKVGGVYKPTDDGLIRVTKSHDIRAPTAAESNPNTTTVLLPLTVPSQFGGGTVTVATIQGGNPSLNLEKADTFTAGLVLTPTFVPRFRFSADYYNIRVKGAIDSLSAPVVLAACAQQNLLCNLITFSGTPRASAPTQAFVNFQNLSRINARGLEFISEYRIPDVFGGALDLQVNANYVLELQSVGATGLVTQFKGVTGNAGSLTNVLGVPKYKIDGVVTYSTEVWSLTGHGRYIPKSILDPTKIGPDNPAYNINLPNSVSLNTVSSAFYFDLSGSIKIPTGLLGGKGVELYGSVNNLFNKFPPRELRFFGNPLYYDVVGRSFRIGLRTAL